MKQLLKEKKIDPNLRDQDDQPAVIAALRKGILFSKFVDEYFYCPTKTFFKLFYLIQILGQITVLLQLLKDDRTKIDISSDNANTLLHFLVRKQPRDRRKFKDAISALLTKGRQYINMHYYSRFR